MPLPIICEKLISLGIGRPEWAYRRDRVWRWNIEVVAANRAVNDRHVGCAVIIEILRHGAESGAVPAWCGHAGACGAILEEAARMLFPKGVGFLDEVSHEDIEYI